MNSQKCPFEFESPSVDKNSGASPVDYSQASQLSGFKNLPQNSSAKKNEDTSTYQVVITPTSEEEMESTQESENFSQYQSLYSYIKPQNYFGLNNINPSQNPDGNCFTPAQNQDNLNLVTTQNLIDEHVTLPSINTIHPVYSKLTAYNTPSQANATINTVLEFDTSSLLETTSDSQRILAETTPVKSRNVSVRQKISFQDAAEDHDNDACGDGSFATQDLLKAAMMDCEILPEISKADASICTQPKEADLQNPEKNFQPQDIHFDSQIQKNTFFGFTNENTPTEVNTGKFFSYTIF